MWSIFTSRGDYYEAKSFTQISYCIWMAPYVETILATITFVLGPWFWEWSHPWGLPCTYVGCWGYTFHNHK